jgi:hypothetical protein
VPSTGNAMIQKRGYDRERDLVAALSELRDDV